MHRIMLPLSILLAIVLLACGGDGDGVPSSSTPGATETSGVSEVPTTAGTEPTSTEPRSGDTTPDPVDSTRDPVDSTRDPVDSTPDPVDSTPDPVGSTPDPGDTTPDPAGSTPAFLPVRGVVWNGDGDPIPEVAVEIGGEEVARTDAQGEFTLELASNAAHALTFAHPAYVPDHKPIRLEGGDEGAHLAVVLTRRGTLLVLEDAAAGGTLTSSDLGARVVFPANALVNGAGEPVTGPVALRISPVDLGSPLGPESFPGTAAALDAGGDATELESFGVMDITFEDPEIRIADGARVTIEIPLTAGALSNGDTTPLWFLDPETGLWQEEGEGTVIFRGGRRYLQGEVSHFSWWNCDIGVSGISLPFRIEDWEGEPINEPFEIRLQFSGEDEGVFNPFRNLQRSQPAPFILFPTERDVRISVSTGTTGRLGSVRKVIAADRTTPVVVQLDPPVERFTLPRDEALTIPLDEGEVIYLDVELEDDEARFLLLESEEGLRADFLAPTLGPIAQPRSLPANGELRYNLYRREAGIRSLRVEALSAGTLVAQDTTPELALNEIRRVELSGELKELSVFLREGQWVRLAGRSADPESTVGPFLNLTGRTSQDGSQTIGSDVIRVGRTGTYLLTMSVSAPFSGPYDVVVRELDPPTAVPFSPTTLGIAETLELELGGGRLYQLPLDQNGSIEGWARSANPDHRVVVRNDRWRADIRFGNGAPIRSSASGAINPVPERGFAGTLVDSNWTNLHVLAFIGRDDPWMPEPVVEIDVVLATWSGSVDELIVGDPETPGCTPNARTALAGWSQLGEEGRITFCPGEHNLRNGRIDLDTLDMRGAGMDETQLRLWRGEAIHDARSSGLRTPSQNWSIRDLEIQSFNVRSGNEGNPALDFQSNTDASTFLAERIRIRDSWSEISDTATFGGSGIDLSNRTANRLFAEIRDSEFSGFDTAIRPYSGARVTLTGNTVTDTRRGIVASDVIELIARNNILEVRDQGIEHSGNQANRSVYEDNLIVRSERGTTAYCLYGVSRETDLEQPLEDPLSIMRNNTCLDGEGNQGLWLAASGRGGGLIEGNRLLPIEGADPVSEQGIRLSWSAPTGTIHDDPGLIRIVNNVLVGYRSTNGIISVFDAQNFGPIEIVNNTLDLVEGTGSGRSRGIRITAASGTTGLLPITILNNLINGAGNDRDHGITLNRADLSVTSEGNWLANLAGGHMRDGSNDALPGYAEDNTSSAARVVLDEEGRPVAGSASIDGGVQRAEVPATDIDGVARPQGGGVDPGAHEQ